MGIAEALWSSGLIQAVNRDGVARSDWGSLAPSPWDMVPLSWGPTLPRPSRPENVDCPSLGCPMTPYLEGLSPV